MKKFLNRLSTDPYEERARFLGNWEIGRENRIRQIVMQADAGTLQDLLRQVDVEPVSSDCQELRAQMLQTMKLDSGSG